MAKHAVGAALWGAGGLQACSVDALSRKNHAPVLRGGPGRLQEARVFCHATRKASNSDVSHHSPPLCPAVASCSALVHCPCAFPCMISPGTITRAAPQRPEFRCEHIKKSLCDLLCVSAFAFCTRHRRLLLTCCKYCRLPQGHH
jgi:hypothetical protein